ncbi:hypothetical protein HK44_004665 [Pseudomonas fluorescens HK44]|uniref:Uncharacterized protein n=1 Tax=Pseudomonas fluorescens HK44 TaxID=1042209 RepID=A0A010SM99_PSEFL|nr:hypothetical protein [Pseudomonas fluorescens]EXF94085.1 hypothetical protein HK44_004665 [Pseudomonas fluorescens HK44]
MSYEARRNRSGIGRLWPNIKQADRTYSWHDCARFIKRTLDAADSQPGVLAQIQLDMVHNRQQFAERCRNFVFKRKTCQTPQRLIAPWALEREATLIA